MDLDPVLNQIVTILSVYQQEFLDSVESAVVKCITDQGIRCLTLTGAAAGTTTAPIFAPVLALPGTLEYCNALYHFVRQQPYHGYTLQPAFVQLIFGIVQDLFTTLYTDHSEQLGEALLAAIKQDEELLKSIMEQLISTVLSEIPGPMQNMISQLIVDNVPQSVLALPPATIAPPKNSLMQSLVPQNMAPQNFLPQNFLALPGLAGLPKATAPKIVPQTNLSPNVLPQSTSTAQAVKPATDAAANVVSSISKTLAPSGLAPSGLLPSTNAIQSETTQTAVPSTSTPEAAAVTPQALASVPQSLLPATAPARNETAPQNNPAQTVPSVIPEVAQSSTAEFPNLIQNLASDATNVAASVLSPAVSQQAAVPSTSPTVQAPAAQAALPPSLLSKSAPPSSSVTKSVAQGFLNTSGSGGNSTAGASSNPSISSAAGVVPNVPVPSVNEASQILDSPAGGNNALAASLTNKSATPRSNSIGTGADAPSSIAEMTTAASNPTTAAANRAETIEKPTEAVGKPAGSVNNPISSIPNPTTAVGDSAAKITNPLTAAAGINPLTSTTTTNTSVPSTAAAVPDPTATTGHPAEAVPNPTAAISNLAEAVSANFATPTTDPTTAIPNATSTAPATKPDSALSIPTAAIADPTAGVPNLAETLANPTAAISNPLALATDATSGITGTLPTPSIPGVGDALQGSPVPTAAIADPATAVPGSAETMANPAAAISNPLGLASDATSGITETLPTSSIPGVGDALQGSPLNAVTGALQNASLPNISDAASNISGTTAVSTPSGNGATADSGIMNNIVQPIMEVLSTQLTQAIGSSPCLTLVTNEVNNLMNQFVVAPMIAIIVALLTSPLLFGVAWSALKYILPILALTWFLFPLYLAYIAFRIYTFPRTLGKNVASAARVQLDACFATSHKAILKEIFQEITNGEQLAQSLTGSDEVKNLLMGLATTGMKLF